jgi:hypothetical protein
MVAIYVFTPEAAAKHELLFNKPASGSLNNSSSIAAALGVTKI